MQQKYIFLLISKQLIMLTSHNIIIIHYIAAVALSHHTVGLCSLLQCRDMVSHISCLRSRLQVPHQPSRQLLSWKMHSRKNYHFFLSLSQILVQCFAPFASFKGLDNLLSRFVKKPNFNSHHCENLYFIGLNWSNL